MTVAGPALALALFYPVADIVILAVAVAVLARVETPQRGMLGLLVFAFGVTTIADIACYPVMSYLADAGYDTADFPASAAWIERFRAQSGFAPQLELMPIENWPPA